MDAPWGITLFGQLSAEQPTRRVITRFSTHKTGALLAFLAYHPHKAHPREVLTEMLWPDADTRPGRHRLSMALSSLRNQLEPPDVPSNSVLLADRFHIQLNPAAIVTDVALFETALRSAATTPSAADREHTLGGAVRLWGGPLLDGYYEDWILAERERLQEQFFQTAGQLMALQEQAGNLHQALELARRCANLDPLRDEAHHELMRLLVATGQPAAALRQYQGLEQRLQNELNSFPSAACRDLACRIRRREDAVSPGPAPSAGLVAPPAFAPNKRPMPAGTVTLLLGELTDDVGAPAAWKRCRALLRAQFEQHNGFAAKASNGALVAAFTTVGDAVDCAVACQRTIAAHQWPDRTDVPAVRMALHTGDVQPANGSYQGAVLDQGTRILVAGHGGQILVSAATAALFRVGNLPARKPDQVSLTNLGVYRLVGAAASEPLFQVEYPGLATRSTPPVRVEAGFATRLPLPLTRFFGRDEELAQLEQWLCRAPVRLVTLTGAGGTGKTRLALEAAATLTGRLLEAPSATTVRPFEAVWFVPLADLTDPDHLLPRVLNTLGLTRSSQIEPIDQIAAALAAYQPALLVLDNFEHLASGGAIWVQTLLQRAPSLRCLVSSRQPLALDGEHELALRPLPVPGAGEKSESLARYPSVCLLVDRAQAVRPDFQLTANNADVVTALVRRLEGIPLALELAAARAQVLSPTQMLSQIAHRFDFLVSRKRAVPPRHRTLWSAIDWSYQLLPPHLQHFWAQLSLFRGGWTCEAVETVCVSALAAAPRLDARSKPVLDLLAELQANSLVVAEEASSRESPGDLLRFRMLETLREFAQQQLAQEERARLARSHAHYFLVLAEQADPQLDGPDQLVWLDRLEREHDNLRAALDWCRTADEGAEKGLRFVRALWPFWCVRGFLGEAQEWAAAALERAGSPPTRKAGGAEPVPDPLAELKARVLIVAGNAAGSLGNYTAARTHFEESLRLWRALANVKGAATCLNNLGNLALFQSEFALACTFFEQSLILSRQISDKARMSNALSNLGELVCWQGEYQMARALHEESLAVCRDLGDAFRTANSLCCLGDVAYQQGDHRAARSRYRQCFLLCRKLGDKGGMGTALLSFGDLRYQRGNWASARLFYEKGLTVHRELGNKRGVAFALCGLGNVARKQGEHASARLFYQEALMLRQALRDKKGVARCLEALAEVWAARKKTATAVRLLGAACVLRDAIGLPLPPLLRAEHEATLGALSAAVGKAAFATLWASGQALAWEQAIDLAAGGDVTKP